VSFQDIIIDLQPAPCAFLIIGIPGAGKTTVATALAERFPLAAHADDHVMNRMFVSGWREPAPDGDPEASRQILLRARNSALLMDSFFAAGVIPVFDDVVVRRSHLDFYLVSVRSRPLHVVVLAPRLEVVISRDAMREKHLAATWAFLDGELRAELAGAGVWIDSSDLTVAETVDLILTRTGVTGPPECPAGGTPG
jgi:gluconate kinase